MKKVAVIGTGYVGLVTGACFAENGNQVFCVDIDENKVQKLKLAEVPIYEPGLEPIVKRNITQKRLHFTTQLKEAIDFADIVFLALPTPLGDDGAADLTYILSTANEIGKIILEKKIIVDKSTVPVGTSEKVRIEIEKNSKVDFSVVSNPEFLREGFAIKDFLSPERIVLGLSDDYALKIMTELYEPFIRSKDQLIIMDETSAELTKYAANSFLATKITFMNEIANFCECVGADVDMVREGIGSDSRIGSKFLYPGIGFGGSCFPKDIKAIVKSGLDHDYNFQIIQSVIDVNKKQKLLLFDKVKNYFGNIEGMQFALWGLSFKPDTDDIREASSLSLISSLINAGARVICYDPQAMLSVKSVFGDRINYVEDKYDALKESDALLIATEWSMFLNPDFDRMQNLLNKPVIFDGRNIYDLEAMSKQGFYYNSIGRKTIFPS